MGKIEALNKGYFTTMSEFKIIKQIGVGSFGKVKLALHIPTRKKYAIKIIDLKENFNCVEIKLIERQIKSHINLDHPHIIKLWDTFEQDTSLYMIMEYAVNGSLFRYHSNLLNKGIFPTREQVHKFFSQVVSALKYMHNSDLMHRDIKPQNILLDDDLNIKICDFGWVTNQISNLRNTFCGTYQYMAPQMVLQKSYDYRIDIWAIGVLLYELIHGKAPFPGEDLDSVKNKINLGSYEISNTISLPLKNLISDILQFSPEKRPSLSQIQKHPWILSQQFAQNFTQEQPKIKNYRPSDLLLHTIQHSLQRDKKKPLHSITKNETLDKTKHAKKCGQNFSALFTQSKETIKSSNQPKRIKKKCKTQGEEEIASYQDYIFFQNSAPKKKNQSITKIYEDQTIRIKKENNNKQVREFKRNKEMKENYNHKKTPSGNFNQSRTKIRKGKKHPDKASCCDLNGDKIRKIEDKLGQLSNKFFVQKSRDSKMNNI